MRALARTFVATIAATLGSVAPGVPVSAEPCTEDLSGILAPRQSRSLAPGVHLSVWEGTRAGPSPAQRSVRASVLHASSGSASLAPILALPDREDPAQLLSRSAALAAVNGDLFSAFASDATVPSGPVVVGGRVRYAPPQRHAVVHWGTDRPRVHRSVLRASVTVEAGNGRVRIPVAAVNHPTLTDGAVVFAAPWTGRTTRGRATLVVRGGRLVDVIRGGRAVERRAGETIVQVPDASAVPAGLRRGDRVLVRARLGRTGGDASAVGHGGRLLRDGAVTRECRIPGSLLRPRTALAWNDAGDIWLAVVSNGRGDPADGMRIGGASVTAFGTWLAGLGATDAVLLDGGGSTIMLRRGRTDVQRVDLPESAYRRPVPVLLGVVLP